MSRRSLPGRIKDWIQKLSPAGRKKLFLSKRTMVLIDNKSGLMECRVCGSRHFALMPPVGGNEYVGIPGFRRGSWQCVNGCRIDPDKEKKAVKGTVVPPSAGAGLRDMDPDSLLDHPEEQEKAESLDTRHHHQD